MRKSARTLTIGAAVLAAGVLLGTRSAQAQTAFNAGDLVIYRVGDGSAPLSSAATAVFLDEYSPTGTLVRSMALPTLNGGGSNAFTASGSATSEGLVSLSSNGQYLAITGYNAAAGTAGVSGTTSAAVNRAVNIFDSTGAIRSSTLLSDLSTGNNVRGAVSMDDGNSFYAAGGAGGVRYATVGATTSTQLSTTTTNIRAVSITGGQLYASSSNGSTRIATVGAGLPTTSGQTITNLPGVTSTNSSSPYQFAFADLNPSVAGVDTLYVADSSLGVQKYSLVGGTWTLNNAITTTGLTGLTLSVVGTTVNVYATGPGNLYALTDTSGYNANDNGTLTSIATATTNEALRGLSFAPSIAPVPEPATVFGGLLLVGALGWNQRRRLSGLVGQRRTL